jgi:hypothetical protein
MFSGIHQRWKSLKAASREGEAPAEPSSLVTLVGRSGSAGASPSQYGSACEQDDLFGSRHLLVATSCDFNTEHGAVRLEHTFP